MFTYRVEYFVLKPGLFLLALGLILTLPLSFGPVTIGPISFSLYWMLLGLTLAVLGLQSFYFGCLAQVFATTPEAAAVDGSLPVYACGGFERGDLRSRTRDDASLVHLLRQSSFFPPSGTECD